MGELVFMDDTATVNQIPSAKWATIEGSFTSEELRKIADKIDDNYKTFKEGQKRGK